MNDNELNQNQVLNDENQQPENNGKSNLDNMMISLCVGGFYASLFMPFAGIIFASIALYRSFSNKYDNKLYIFLSIAVLIFSTLLTIVTVITAFNNPQTSL